MPFLEPLVGCVAPCVLQRRAACLRGSRVDGRTKRSGEQCNFYIFYEVDDEEVPTALRLEEYGVDEECGWVLLEAEREGAARRSPPLWPSDC